MSSLSNLCCESFLMGAEHPGIFLVLQSTLSSHWNEFEGKPSTWSSSTVNVLQLSLWYSDWFSEDFRSNLSVSSGNLKDLSLILGLFEHKHT